MHDAERQMLNVKYHDVYYGNHKFIIEKLDFCLFSKESYRGVQLKFKTKLGSGDAPPESFQMDSVHYLITRNLELLSQSLIE